MKASNIMIGIILFGAITGGMWFFIHDMGEDYSIDVDETYIDRYNQIDNLTSEITDPMRDTVKDSSGVEEGSNAVKLSSGVYAGFKSIFGLPSFMNNIVQVAALALGIPGYYVGIMFAIIGVIITFIVISAVFGRNL